MKPNVLQTAVNFDKAYAAWQRARNATIEAIAAEPFDQAYFNRCRNIQERLRIPVYQLSEKLYQIRNAQS